jgi:NAD(P)-dependent dehydrogenase (short-subunit alcohol dehydrogenase family)
MNLCMQVELPLRVNLTGAFLCSREALPLMRGRGGSIVQIGSVAARIAYSLRAGPTVVTWKHTFASRSATACTVVGPVYIWL